MAEDTIKDEEYAPITQELRDYMKMRRLSPSEVVLSYCDNIDALHKSLEEQNAKLHEKVLNQRKQLADVQEAIERRNNGVLKRRWQKKMDALKNENEEMRNFNYRVREAIRRHEDLTLWGRDYMPYPVDADDVPIHVGDRVTDGENVMTVVGIRLSAAGWFIECADRHHSTSYLPTTLCHYHARSVEEVLHEFLDECENATLRGYSEVPQEVFDNYAKRLQLADGDAE